MPTNEGITSSQASGPDQYQQYQLSLLERIIKKLSDAHRLCVTQSPGDVTGLVTDAAAYFQELHRTIPQQPHVKPAIQLRLALVVPAPEREEPLPRWIADRRPA